MYTSKFSPTEKKALEFAKHYHQGQERIGGKDYITHPIEVVDLLFHYRFRGKYVFTALCHDLLEDTDATEQEILKEIFYHFCSQPRQEGWYEQLGGDNSTIADAILDRIVHDAYKINIESIEQLESLGIEVKLMAAKLQMSNNN